VGLDMFMRSYKKSDFVNPDSKVDLVCSDPYYVQGKEQFYWRKYSDLQGFLHSEYIAAGGKEPDFNGPLLRIDKELVDRLESLLSDSKVLEPASGFFWGQMSEEKYDYLRQDVARMQMVIDNLPDDEFLLFYASY